LFGKGGEEVGREKWDLTLMKGSEFSLQEILILHSIDVNILNIV
jgi:hypothetical protein